MAKIDLSDQMNEALRPIRLLTIAGEAIQEVKRARVKHGSNDDLADGIGTDLSWYGALIEHGDLENDNPRLLSFPSNYEMELAQQKVNDDACAAGRKHTRLGVLLEEAFEAGAAVNLEDLRTELIQVAAMALDWVADIDVRS